MNKKLILILIVIVIIFTILFVPSIKSYVIMSVYSKISEKNSIMNEENFDLDIPTGLYTKEIDWYPFMLCFNADNFYNYINEDVDLTILYNFGSFEKGRSTFYDENSDYYSAFYGGYIIKYNSGNKKYGFNTKGELNYQQLIKLSKYDLGHLVLMGLGCPVSSLNINYKLYDIKENIDYLNYTDWFQIDANIKSNSPLHSPKKNYISYIQYGKPPNNFSGENFKPINLKGRLYIKFFEEINSTICLYIIAPNMKIIEKTDKDILSSSNIHIK